MGNLLPEPELFIKVAIIVVLVAKASELVKYVGGVASWRPDGRGGNFFSPFFSTLALINTKKKRILILKQNLLFILISNLI
jgi:hypothetical protein